MQASSPNNSYLETCVLLWSLGDYFLLPDLCQEAGSLLWNRCGKLFFESRFISAIINEIRFLPDLEAGIRAAWRADRGMGPVRTTIMAVCRSLHPVLGKQRSFMNLLRELPEFAIEFLEALLVWDELQSGKILWRRCCRCQNIVQIRTRGDDPGFAKGAFIVTPVSLGIHCAGKRFYCSQNCYNTHQGLVGSRT